MIRAGNFDRLIRFERNTPATIDSIGAPVAVWAKLREAWAKVSPVSGAETFKSAKELSSRVSLFYCHYFAGLTAKDRISYDGLKWDILGIKEIGRRELLEITAQAVE